MSNDVHARLAQQQAEMFDVKEGTESEGHLPNDLWEDNNALARL
jgi:hypothetical protein